MKTNILDKTKRLFRFVVYTLLPLGGGWVGGACSDMLDTESTRQNIEPELTSKTDSIFYGFGILQAMQELADQYVMLGEMRGDLVKTTDHTDNNLRQLANFSATTANRYDSAYVYYRVINNCNYYIAHRDTALYRGATNVVIDEYAAVKAIRAWAYLQLGRNYERVPFFTEPLTQISQIDNNQYPELTLSEIVSELASDLEPFSGYQVPNYGLTSALSIGSPNWTSTAKRFLPSKCFIPVDVVLGDMYLETGNYDAAARHYITYLTQVSSNPASPYLAPMRSKLVSLGRYGTTTDEGLPDASQISAIIATTPAWAEIFGENSVNDIITYIPMAVNRVNGLTTEVPLIFGFNYYATSEERSDNGERQPYVDEIQLLPSDALNLLSDSTEYYYYLQGSSTQGAYDTVGVATCGDMRLRSILHTPTTPTEDNLDVRWIDKYKYANIILYRNSTVLLRLAEAFNRLGMPDAAFGILKDGITTDWLRQNSAGEYVVSYITDDTRRLLQTTYPLLSDANASKFPATRACGIHCHGAGKGASDFAMTTYKPGSSPYTMQRMTAKKFDELASLYGITIGTTREDTINAVEDLICDEYALETAFEGNRFADLCRLARHKNKAGLYSANFGSRWLARKLDYKQPTVNLEDDKNWYLPFK